jgi:hypothetical protein
MADRRRRKRGFVLVGLLAGAAGAGAWWYLRKPGGPVTDQWAVATATPSAPAPEPVASEPVASEFSTPEPVEAPTPSDMPATSSVEPVGAAVEDEPAPARPATLFDAATPSPASGFTPAPSVDSPTVAIPAVNPKEPYGPGSAAPLADGSAPSAEFTIKGNASSMLFHPPSSPYYERTKPEAWFRTAEDAEQAGFTEWRPKPRAT